MKVLVVDDDAVARLLMTRILSKLGCKVSVAENGEMALGMILGCSYGRASREMSSQGNGEYSVVFLDNHLPGISGQTIVAKLRELKRQDFVVGVTGDAQPCHHQEFLSAGVNYVLTKPIHERSLREVLSYVR